MNIQQFIENEYRKKEVSTADILDIYESTYLREILGKENVSDRDLSPDVKLWYFIEYTKNAINNLVYERIKSEVMCLWMDSAIDVFVGKDASLDKYDRVMKYASAVLQSSFSESEQLEWTGIPYDNAVSDRYVQYMDSFHRGYF